MVQCQVVQTALGKKQSHKVYILYQLTKVLCIIGIILSKY